MEFGTANWPSIIQNFGTTMNGWLANVGPGTVAISAVVLAVVFLLCKKLSDWFVGGIEALLKRFSVSLTDEITSQLKIAVQVLAVADAGLALRLREDRAAMTAAVEQKNRALQEKIGAA